MCVFVKLIHCRRFPPQSLAAILDSVLHDDLPQSKVYLAGFVARAVAEVPGVISGGGLSLQVKLEGPYL